MQRYKKTMQKPNNGYIFFEKYPFLPFIYHLPPIYHHLAIPYKHRCFGRLVVDWWIKHKTVIIHARISPKIQNADGSCSSTPLLPLHIILLTPFCYLAIHSKKNVTPLSETIKFSKFRVLLLQFTTIFFGSFMYPVYICISLPSRLYERNGDNYEASIEVISYDSYGNPTEIVDLKAGNKDNGIHSVFVWDTYGRYLIALIKNVKLSQVQSATSQLSTGTSQSRFNTLKSLLPNAQIQTWAYKPLIGVTSHTDINSQTLLYEYDGLGRLKAVKRVVNGSTAPEIINEYEYNYKNTSL